MILPCLEISSKQSQSELIADLHLIKLFIHHTLRFERALQNVGALPKIAAACINASFDEMQKEGYADDGLFSTMGEFFLPLTISEEELRQSRDYTESQQQQLRRLEQIDHDLDELQRTSDEATNQRSEWERDMQNLINRQNAGHQSSENNQSEPNVADVEHIRE